MFCKLKTVVSLLIFIPNNHNDQNYNRSEQTIIVTQCAWYLFGNFNWDENLNSVHLPR